MIRDRALFVDCLYRLEDAILHRAVAARPNGEDESAIVQLVARFIYFS